MLAEFTNGEMRFGIAYEAPWTYGEPYFIDGFVTPVRDLDTAIDAFLSDGPRAGTICSRK